jgi:hypothetical protein
MSDNVRPYRSTDLASYCFWKSLPSSLKGRSSETLRRLGIGDAYSHELLEIRDQRDFARHFSLSERTLTRWNKVIAKDGALRGKLEWARPLTANVVLALYRQAMAMGRAKEVMAWMEIVEGGVRPGRGRQASLSEFLASAGPSRTDAA